MAISAPNLMKKERASEQTSQKERERERERDERGIGREGEWGRERESNTAGQAKA